MGLLESKGEKGKELEHVGELPNKEGNLLDHGAWAK